MLKNALNTEAELKQFTQAVRNTLTPATLLQALTHKTVSDPALIDAITRAVGKKQHTPLSTRLGDTISASLLGFNNPHEMFAYYKDGNGLFAHNFSYTHRHGNDVITVYAPKGVQVTAADMACFAHIDFEPTRSDEDLRLSNTNLAAISRDRLHDGETLIPADSAGGMLIMLPSFIGAWSQEFACDINDDPAHAADALSELKFAAVDGGFHSSGNAWLADATDCAYFETEGGDILAVLHDTLLPVFNQYAKELNAFDPEDVGDEQYYQQLGRIGLMWSREDMWMALYCVEDGLPIAVSTIPLHQQDIRRGQFR